MRATEVRADFPPDPASAGQARRFLDTTLRTWKCDALIDIAVLLVSELVSNAILHAGTSVRVVIKLADGRMRVEVRDGSARGPATKHYSSMATTGRGLVLVEELADDWGVDASRAGKTVWFELGRPEPMVGAAGSSVGHRVGTGAPPDHERGDAGPGHASGAPSGGTDLRPRLLVTAGPRWA